MTLDLEKFDFKQHFTQPSPHYTEASLVRALEERSRERDSFKSRGVRLISVGRMASWASWIFWDVFFSFTDWAAYSTPYALRIYSLADLKESLSRDQFRLYQLIWKRFTASRMNPAKYETIAGLLL